MEIPSELILSQNPKIGNIRGVNFKFVGKEAKQMYAPHWFDNLYFFAPWIIPAIAIISLWIARGSDDKTFRVHAERLFFMALLVVAGATLRTLLVNDGCWLVHTASLAAMIVGAIFPTGETSPVVES